MSKKLTKSLLIYGIGAGLSQSIVIFLLPVYTSVLSKEQYGVYELLYSGFLLMNLLGMCQMDSAVGRYYYEAKNKRERNAYVLTGLMVLLFLSAVTACLGFVFSETISAWIFKVEEYSRAIKIIALTIPVANFYNYFLLIVRFDNKQWYYVIATLCQILLTAGLTIFYLFQKNEGIAGIFKANLFGFLTASLIIFFFYGKSFVAKSKFDKKILKEYFHFSLPLFPAVIGSWLNNHISKFLMLLYLTKGDIGVYATGLKVASIFKFGDYIFRIAWTPFYLGELNKEGHKELFAKVYNYVLCFSGLALLGFFLLDRLIISLLVSQNEFLEASKYALPLAFSIVLVWLVQVVGIGPIVAKKTIYNTYNFFISLLVFFALFFILTPSMGINGVVISQIGSALTLFMVSWYNSNKLYFINFNKIYTAIFIFFILLLLYLN